MAHQPGDLLGGRYRLDDRIAAGGMGEVWQATDTVLGRAVAVKTLLADRAEDPQFQIRFRHEARAMAALRHPGIADVYDFGQEPGADAYLVMARVDGQSLDRRLAQLGRLSAAETMSIVAQAGRALQAAHAAGIVHRDVKPGNLIIQPDGAVVLVDFGVARSTQSAALTGAREVVGTALYIAPEQVSKKTTGPPADVYALGAVAYHCLAGHPPFAGDNPVAVAMQHLQDDPPPLPDDVPAPVRELVATALAKDPAARFPSADAMAAAAERLAPQHATTLTEVRTAALAGPSTTRVMAAPVAAGAAVLPPVRTGHASPVVAPPPPPTDPRPGSRRGPALLAVLLLALLGMGAALAVTDPFGWFPGPTKPAESTPGPGRASVPPSQVRQQPVQPDGGDEDNKDDDKSAPSASPTGRSPAPSRSSARPQSSAPESPAATSPSGDGTTDPPESPASGNTGSGEDDGSGDDDSGSDSGSGNSGSGSDNSGSGSDSNSGAESVVGAGPSDVAGPNVVALRNGSPAS